ncbi:MAG: NAD(P)-binding protein, partial [Pseudomonadales bacterium]|nr:NAD(P)-binding protein [Pseudomonadales bacterium]
MKKIAVIGGGIAGLTAVWRLGQSNEVVLFEGEQKPGFGAHSLAYQNNPTLIDTPLRVFYKGYYPNLTKLYDELDIESEWVNYESSFSMQNEASFFNYKNLRLGSASIPFMPFNTIGRQSMDIIANLGKFYVQGYVHQKQGRTLGLSAQDYLEQHRFSESFIYRFLYPAFCGICTCSVDAIKQYPIDFIIDYLHQGVMWQGVHRVKNGVQEVIEKINTRASQVHCGLNIECVEYQDNGVCLTDQNQNKHYFDDVIIAAQAPKALNMLGQGFEQEKQCLSDIEFESSDVVVHTDTNLAPKDSKAWRSVNFILPENYTEEKTMATIWLNQVMPNNWEQPVFETWNPVVEPNPDKVLK